MFKASLFSTVFAAMAIQASADPLSSVDLSGLPADVAARIVHLQSYGDRFEPVVAATLAEWSKPSYTGAGSDPTRVVPARSWFAEFASATQPASAREADDRLAHLFDAAWIRDADPALLVLWYACAISDPMTSDALRLASTTGIDAVLEGLLDTHTVHQFVATLEPDSAQPLFAILFHPAFLEALVEDTDERQANWSSMVDTLEGLYPFDH